MSLTLNNTAVGVVCAGLFAAAAGCGALSRMGSKTDEMNQTTKDMAAETKRMREETERMRADAERVRAETERMRQETERMRKETESMSGRMGEVVAGTGDAAAAGRAAAENSRVAGEISEYIYHDSRQGDALRIRREQLAAMDASDDQESKVAEAAKYYKAFEFQLWRGEGAHHERKREMLFDDAALEFFRAVNGLVRFNGDVNVDATDNKAKNLFALAVTAHLLNPVQEEHLSEADRVSFYDLVKMGLARASRLRTDEAGVSDLRPFERYVAEKHREAHTLLRARSNFLAALVLSKVSSANSTGFSGIKALLARVSMMVAPWEPKLEGANVVEIETWNEYLAMSNETRDAMRALGIDPRIDGRLITIFGNMRVSSNAFAAREDLRGALERFADEVRGFAQGR